MENIRFSDIIKFILLGGVGSLFIGLTLVVCLPGEVYDEILSVFSAAWSDSGHIFSVVSNTFIGVMLLALFYLVGIVLQGIRIGINNMLSGFAAVKNVGSMCNSCGKTSWWKNSTFLKCLYAFYFYSYENYCYAIRSRSGKGDASLPGWIYLSHSPAHLTELIASAVSDAKTDGQHSADTNRYLNELLTSLSALLRILGIVIFCCCLVRILCFGQTWDNNSQLHLALILLPTFIFMDVIFILLARAYALNYLKSLDSRSKAKFIEDDSKLRRLMYAQGAPTVYIGIRVSDNRCEDYLSMALESIKTQRYLNLRVIVIHDSDEEAVDSPNSPRRIVARFNEEHGSKLAGRISYSHKNCKGPAGALLAMRDQFLKAGTGEDDIFIMLDDDDRFHSGEAVYDIVLSLRRNRADIALGCFESVDALGMDITNNGGSTHNLIAADLEKNPCQGVYKNNIYKASSIGWTKSYTRKAMAQYCSLLNTEELRNRFKELATYEDFPDIVALLMKNTILTGVTHPTHAYYKRPNSITGTPMLSAFSENRAGFLSFTIKMAAANKDKLVDGAMNVLMHFVIFKTIQICNILAKYRNEATAPLKDGKASKLPEFVDVDPLRFFPQALAKAIEDDGIEAIAREYLASAYGLVLSPDEPLVNCIYAAMRREFGPEEKNPDIDIEEIRRYTQELKQ